MRPGIDVECREVGLRDGLQIQQVFFATEGKIAWLRAEAAAGMPEIEACSFVPPKLLPQFADNLEVVAAALAIDGTCISALAPNLKGAENAFKAGIHKLNYVTSVSESHNMANVRRTVDESVADFERIVAARDAAQPTPAGERNARAFELFRDGKSLTDVVIALRVTSSMALRLRREYSPGGVYFDPDAMAASLAAYETAGVQHVVLALNTGDVDTITRLMETIAREVIPRFL